MREELGKILIDVAKLVIGGVILSALMEQEINPVYLFTVGSFTAVFLIVLGLIFKFYKER